MKKNLFVIGSPLQFLNALEAINIFKPKNIILVVIYNNIINNINQLEAQIEKMNFDEIIKIYPSKIGKFFEYVKLVKYLKKYQYDKIFIGETGSAFRIILANVKKNKVFLLDDGTATIVDYDKKIKKNKLNTYNYRELRFLLVGLKLKVKDTINFFTYYELPFSSKVEIFKNKLEYLKKDFKNNNKDYSDIIFFLGQPLSIFSDKKEFNGCLENVIKKYKDKKIIYIPHRSEEKSLIDIVKSIDERIEILDINQPIEQYFLNNGIYPKYVISYFSTALTTTRILFSDCVVEYIRIKNPSPIIDTKYLNTIYGYFERDNILEFK